MTTTLYKGRIIDNNYTWEPFLCEPFNCLLTSRACAINRAMAIRAFNQLSDNISLFTISEYDIDRLVYCCQCPKFPHNSEDVDILLRKGLNELIHVINAWDEFGFDEELSRIRTRDRKRRYRERLKVKKLKELEVMNNENG